MIGVLGCSIDLPVVCCWPTSYQPTIWTASLLRLILKLKRCYWMSFATFTEYGRRLVRFDRFLRLPALKNPNGCYMQLSLFISCRVWFQHLKAFYNFIVMPSLFMIIFLWSSTILLENNSAFQHVWIGDLIHLLSFKDKKRLTC